MNDPKVGDVVIYRDLGGARREATVTYVYEGACLGDLELAIEGTGEILNRVQRWDGKPEHIMCWEPKPA